MKPQSQQQDIKTERLSEPTVPNRARVGKLGVGLILLSGVLWFSLFAIPFLPISIGQKTVLGAGTFIGVQISWWSGAALAGPEVVQRIRGWFRRRRSDSQG